MKLSTKQNQEWIPQNSTLWNALIVLAADKEMISDRLWLSLIVSALNNFKSLFDILSLICKCSWNWTPSNVYTAVYWNYLIVNACIPIPPLLGRIKAWKSNGWFWWCWLGMPTAVHICFTGSFITVKNIYYNVLIFPPTFWSHG